MMTGMAGEMCAGSSGAPSEPPLLLPSASAQPASQPLPLGDPQVLGGQVGPGSPRKIWTGDSMVGGCGARRGEAAPAGLRERQNWLDPETQTLRTHRPARGGRRRGEPGTRRRPPGRTFRGRGKGRRSARCRPGEAHSPRSSSPALKSAAPHLCPRHGPRGTCPQTAALSPRGQARPGAPSPRCPRAAPRKSSAPKLTSASRRRARRSGDAGPGRGGPARSRGRLSPAGRRAPAARAPAEAPLQPSAGPAARRAAPTTRGSSVRKTRPALGRRASPRGGVHGGAPPRPAPPSGGGAQPRPPTPSPGGSPRSPASLRDSISLSWMPPRQSRCATEL